MRATTIDVYELTQDDLKKLPRHEKILIHDETYDEWGLVPNNNSSPVRTYLNNPEFKAKFYKFVPEDLE